MPAAVVLYVSGHGFGHASRVIEVINAVGRTSPSTRMVIRTAAPKWLFDLTVRVPHHLHAVETDTGIVQRDSLRHDIPETLKRAAAFYRTFEARTERERAFLREAGADLVVGDIPPLAFAAAASAGIPSFALGNFTWDWIYEGYEETRTLAPDAVRVIRDAYSRAREAWRLPLHGGFQAIRHIRDVPFVARHSQRDGDETRRALGIPTDRRVVLSSFGGYGLAGLPLEQVDCLGEYAVVVTETRRMISRSSDRAIERSESGGNGNERRDRAVPLVLTLQEEDIYGSGFRYEDLVRAADVVLTKPGYGILAECLANDTAVVYTSRGAFREYDVLVREMPRLLRCAFIPQEDLFAGRWRAALDTALALPPPPTRVRTDGADVVAQLIAAG